ncbi:MAG: type II 3-dehydroquinate dehydratase [Ilumatobacteraceae bacterium]|nr:type II 3-dehydroquinate dehydratase [Ilumatobacteraceae bacterium]
MARELKILLVNGPNLNLLGSREPEIYGTATLEDLIAAASQAAVAAGFTLDAFQSNSASELVNKIHDARSKYSAIMINPGAFTHYAWSISDALTAFDGPVVEVHISNPQSRESWRHTSVVAPVAIGTIAGFGQQSYVLGVQAIVHYLEHN